MLIFYISGNSIDIDDDINADCWWILFCYLDYVLSATDFATATEWLVGLIKELGPYDR